MSRRVTLGLLLSLSVPAYALSRPHVKELVSESQKFDGQEIEVSGRAAQLEKKTSKAGHDYVVFRLCEADRWVKVFAWGAPEVWDGRQVTVSGVFHAEKKTGELTFKKEIEATAVR